MLCTTLTIALVPSPANAATKWKTGTKVSHSYHYTEWPNTDAWGGSADCPQTFTYSYVEVKRYGDKTFVKDPCKDGASAIAMVIVYNNDWSIRSRKVCRNKYGKGTWAVCDWNWIEMDDQSCQLYPDGAQCGNKALIAGTYDADTGKVYWDHGRSIRFAD